MKYTLLQMAQVIASSMDSDEFTSINDTTESLQIANVIRTAYFDMVGVSNLPEDYTMFNLVETSASTPTRMTLPTDFDNLKWVKYDKETVASPYLAYETIPFVPLEEFHDRMSSLNISETFVDSYTLTIGTSSIPIIYRNDKAPTAYTSYDDNSIVFDSYDVAIEAYLRATKTQCYGRKINTFTMSDSFTPSLDDDQFPQLLNEAKSLAWMELKQTAHQKAEQNARRHKINQQSNKYAIKSVFKSFNELPNFGRKR